MTSEDEVDTLARALASLAAKALPRDVFFHFALFTEIGDERGIRVTTNIAPGCGGLRALAETLAHSYADDGDDVVQVVEVV